MSPNPTVHRTERELRVIQHAQIDVREQTDGAGRGSTIVNAPITGRSHLGQRTHLKHRLRTLLHIKGERRESTQDMYRLSNQTLLHDAVEREVLNTETVSGSQFPDKSAKLYTQVEVPNK